MFRKMSELCYDNDWYAKGKLFIAGTDEAGRGPLAGPVVAASVMLHKDAYIDGLNDSKKLSAKKRETLYELIVNGCICYGIASVDNIEIDKINILNASLNAMKKSVLALSIKPDLILIDGNFTFDTDTDIDKEAVIKGDTRSASIAAASILAKVSRDRIMEGYDKIYPKYGFTKHKGYPTKAHYEAIAEYGVCPIHRKSFRLGIVTKGSL